MELAASSFLLFSHFSLRPTPPRINFCSKRRSNFPKSLISCKSIDPEESDEKETMKSRIGLLQLSVTLTVISTSLPQSPSQAKVTDKKVAEKKRPAKKSPEALSPEELKYWSRGLPTVGDRIPYTEILNLKEQGKLKHIVKLPSVNLKQRTDPVLVILEDSRVLRTVLPTIERDDKFWELWDRLQLNFACINAYTPLIREPEVPSPYLGWLAKFPMSLLKPKPKSKQDLELEKARKELLRLL